MNYANANTIGHFDPFARPAFPARAEAWCPCGTKLSQYRPPQTPLCWPCEAAKLAAVSVVELHPSPHDCPNCGTPIYRGAHQCRTCYGHA